MILLLALGLAAAVEPATRARVIDGALSALQREYVEPEVPAHMEVAVRARAAAHAYDALDANALAAALTADLQAASHDKHLRVVFDGSPAKPGRSLMATVLAERGLDADAMNHGFRKLERLDGNVGLLQLDAFFDPDEPGGRETASSAMDFLSGTDALIIDLRTSMGGNPTMVQLLLSYLFAPKPVHLNDLYDRVTGETEEFWSLPNLPGRRMEKQAVYVLTSARTFSAAEELAYDLQALGRATIVGEVTRGGANPVQGDDLGAGFVIYVPHAKAVNPLTKTNWEGKGVQPEVRVPEAQALKTAHAAALRRLANLQKDPFRRNLLQKALAAAEAK
jgi:retinol-binding protein 3